ncbi:unnamed protein product [Mycena citricolor]|uniref:Copper transporter n=1 Tax=Mycena citricolor TaxID=2018698 RepID=A0AAD2HUI1_9AGAR|nr:unnamed protein product [Mycena citricolor]
MSSPADAATLSSNPFSDNHEAFSGSSTTTNPFATTPRSARTRLPLPHTISDPTPVRDSRPSGMQPSALVVSGLENSALSSQRALTRVLAEKRVVLEEEDDVYDEVWNLPEGFITVYVCPVDPHERPAIHKNLLDKFAMSATVNPHAATRSLLTQTRNSASFRNSPAVHPVALPQQTPTAPTQSKSLQHHHSLSSLAFPLVSSSFLTDLRALYSRTYLNPTLSLYASDLFSAARHHPQLDGMCLTAQSMKDAIDLARAGRVVGADLTGIELVRDDAAFLALQGSEPAQNQIFDSPDIPESPEWPEQTDSKQHVYQPVEVVIEDADQQSIVPSALTGMPGRTGEQEVLEVSEADIARIVPRVMTHRLRVRNGPREELLASAVYPLVDDEHSVEVIEAGTRITVKDILLEQTELTCIRAAGSPAGRCVLITFSTMSHDHSMHSMDMDHGGHGGHDGHNMPAVQCSMNMLWNTQIVDTCIVFESWHIRSQAMFLGSCIAIVALAVFYEYLRAFAKSVDVRIALALAGPGKGKSRSSSRPRSDDEDAGLLTGRRVFNIHTTGTPVPPMLRVLRASLYGATVFLSFFLMLVFMTYNGYLIFATVFGAALGHFIFGGTINVDALLSDDTKGMACH